MCCHLQYGAWLLEVGEHIKPPRQTIGCLSAKHVSQSDSGTGKLGCATEAQGTLTHEAWRSPRCDPTDGGSTRGVTRTVADV